jgi:mRNA interferase MazF
MKKGDIVLISFPFTDFSGNKNRPAIVLINSDDDITVCFITTQLRWQMDYDILIEPTLSNRLKKTSLIRLNKFATLDKNLVIGLLGELDYNYLEILNRNLIKILELD